MKSISISGTSRNIGKKATKALRREGMVPCVIYGGENEVHFSADERAFKNLVYSLEAHICEIDVEGKAYKAILKDIQFHPVTERIIHIDFLELADDREVTMEVPVKLIGNAIGVRNGGKLRQVLRKLDVKALPANLPDAIEIDIEKMKIGTKLSVSDVNAEGFEIINSEKAIIVAVRRARGAMDDEDEDEEGEGEEGAEAAASEESAEA